MDAMGIEKKWKPKMTETYEPNALQHHAYLRQFQKFERIYEALKKEMGSSETHASIPDFRIL
jgi:sugar (pentulose or hexulose) kinase